MSSTTTTKDGSSSTNVDEMPVDAQSDALEPVVSTSTAPASDRAETVSTKSEAKVNLLQTQVLPLTVTERPSKALALTNDSTGPPDSTEEMGNIPPEQPQEEHSTAPGAVAIPGINPELTRGETIASSVLPSARAISATLAEHPQSAVVIGSVDDITSSAISEEGNGKHWVHINWKDRRAQMMLVGVCALLLIIIGVAVGVSVAVTSQNNAVTTPSPPSLRPSSAPSMAPSSSSPPTDSLSPTITHSFVEASFAQAVYLWRTTEGWDDVQARKYEEWVCSYTEEIDEMVGAPTTADVNCTAVLTEQILKFWLCVDDFPPDVFVYEMYFSVWYDSADVDVSYYPSILDNIVASEATISSDMNDFGITPEVWHETGYLWFMCPEDTCDYFTDTKYYTMNITRTNTSEHAIMNEYQLINFCAMLEEFINAFTPVVMNVGDAWAICKVLNNVAGKESLEFEFEMTFKSLIVDLAATSFHDAFVDYVGSPDGNEAILEQFKKRVNVQDATHVSPPIEIFVT